MPSDDSPPEYSLGSVRTPPRGGHPGGSVRTPPPGGAVGSDRRRRGGLRAVLAGPAARWGSVRPPPPPGGVLFSPRIGPFDFRTTHQVERKIPRRGQSPGEFLLF